MFGSHELFPRAQKSPLCKFLLWCGSTGAAAPPVNKLVALRTIAVVPKIVSSVIVLFFFDHPSSIGKRSFSGHMSAENPSTTTQQNNDLPKKSTIKSLLTVPASVSPNAMIGAATSPRLNSSVEAVKV